MNEQGSKKEPLSDLAYDWVTIIQHKSVALRAYEKYMQDARQANSPECLELMRQIYEQDSSHVQQATRHLMEVLREGRMGPETGQGQASQGETQRMREGGARSTGMTQGQGSQGERGQGMREGGTRSTGMTQGMQGGSRQSGGMSQGQGDVGREMPEGGARRTGSEQGQMGQAGARQGETQQSQMEERDVGRGGQRPPRSS